MTHIDQMRDELAGLIGLEVPLSLDSLAAIWERELRGWEWLRYSLLTGATFWAARKQTELGCKWTESFPSTNNFLADFLALTLAAVKASKGATRE